MAIVQVSKQASKAIQVASNLVLGDPVRDSTAAKVRSRSRSYERICC